MTNEAFRSDGGRHVGTHRHYAKRTGTLHLLKSRMIVMEVSPRIADIAFDAYRRYGKVSGHGAALNYGDCFSYALAKHLAVPLLFKGGDFSKTDIRSAADEHTEHHRPTDP